jgi:hypothetical protein
VGGSVPSGPLSRDAAAGRAEGLAMGVTDTAALLDPASATLAGAIAGGGASQGAAHVFRPLDAAAGTGFAFGAHHHHG